MSDLVAFVTARLDERAALARAADGPTWDFEAELADAAHIDANDPAHVLREVAAMRAIVAAYEHKAESMARYPNAGNASGLMSLDGVLKHLAAIWDGHPDYRPEWAP